MDVVVVEHRDLGQSDSWVGPHHLLRILQRGQLGLADVQLDQQTLVRRDREQAPRRAGGPRALGLGQGQPQALEEPRPEPGEVPVVVEPVPAAERVDLLAGQQPDPRRADGVQGQAAARVSGPQRPLDRGRRQPERGALGRRRRSGRARQRLEEVGRLRGGPQAPVVDDRHVVAGRREQSLGRRDCRVVGLPLGGRERERAADLGDVVEREVALKVEADDRRVQGQALGDLHEGALADGQPRALQQAEQDALRLGQDHPPLQVGLAQPGQEPLAAAVDVRGQEHGLETGRGQPGQQRGAELLDVAVVGQDRDEPRPGQAERVGQQRGRLGRRGLDVRAAPGRGRPARPASGTSSGRSG